jgi:hypothetical protein
MLMVSFFFAAKNMAAGTGFCLAFGIVGYMGKKAYVENVNIIQRPENRNFPDQGTFFHYNRTFDPWKKEVKG